jgi:hypothetical protein
MPKIIYKTTIIFDKNSHIGQIKLKNGAFLVKPSISSLEAQINPSFLAKDILNNIMNGTKEMKNLKLQPEQVAAPFQRSKKEGEKIKAQTAINKILMSKIEEVLIKSKFSS